VGGPAKKPRSAATKHPGAAKKPRSRATKPPGAAKLRPRLDGRRSEARGTARAQLLDAAERVLAERGYRGASVDAVAAEAGLTKGAFYWNFASKEELFLGLLEDRFDQRARGLMALTAAAGSDETTSQRVSEGFAQMVDEHRRLVLLMNEFWALSVRDEQLRERWVKRQAALRAELARTLEERHATTGVPLTISATTMATAILALADGLAMDRVAEPAVVPPELFGEMLQLWYDGLARRAG
jgi:AcrR family transcriptional regulator